MIRKIQLSAILILSPLFLHASGADRILVNVWCELEPMVRLDDAYPLPREKAAERLLEEARVFFSSMLYGYAFSYTPLDLARHVEEQFQLTPVAEVPWGSKRLAVLGTEIVEKRLNAKMAYRLSDAELSRRASWESNTIPSATGSGEGNVLMGYMEKFTSFREAVKNAIRGYLRTRIYNKPKEIKGEVLLWEEPETIVQQGCYLTRVKVKLLIREIVPYRIF